MIRRLGGFLLVLCALAPASAGAAPIDDLGIRSELGDVAVQPDGRIVVAGMGRAHHFILRLHPNGQLDRSFSVDGSTSGARAAGHPTDIAIQPDGKIVVAARYVISRYNADGSPDLAFGDQGYIAGPWFSAISVEVMPDGRIIAAGGDQYCGRPGCRGEYALLRRFMPDGSPDPSFGQGGVVSTALTPGEPDVWGDVDLNLDGRIAAVTGGFVARFEPNGDPDSVFGNGGVATTLDLNSQVDALEDGGVLVAGSHYESASRTSVAEVARHGADGELTDDFGNDGIATALLTTGAALTEMRILDSGEVAVAASYSSAPQSLFTHCQVAGGCYTAVAALRFAPSGKLERDWASGGLFAARLGRYAAGWPWAAAILADGRVILGGNVGRGQDEQTQVKLLRLNGSGGIDERFGNAGFLSLPILPRCRGRLASIVGTSRNDRIVGSYINEVIAGLGGADTILGAGRASHVWPGVDDTVCAGRGNDRVGGGLGDDWISGGPGADRLFGGDGNDTLFGGTGPDLTLGGPGRDTVSGGPGRDRGYS